MPSLDRVVDLQKLLFIFNQLERNLYLPDTTNHTDRKETDTEHSYSLAMVAWFLAQDIPQLNTNKCLRYALVHDLLEVHAGDAFAYDKAANATKPEREAKAVKELRQSWTDFPEMITSIDNYQAHHDAESRFVYALDKIMPMVLNYLSDFKTYNKFGITLADIKRVKAPKVAVSPEVTDLYEQLVERFEASPHFN